MFRWPQVKLLASVPEIVYFTATLKPMRHKILFAAYWLLFIAHVVLASLFVHVAGDRLSRPVNPLLFCLAMLGFILLLLSVLYHLKTLIQKTQS